MKKVYISGPMTGIKDSNYPEFEKAEKMLIEMGFIVYSPHKAPNLGTWELFMRYDIKTLMECDYIYMLDGWQNSEGAKLEFFIADKVCISVLNL